MLTVLSPAKKLEFEPAPGGLPGTQPRFRDDTEILVSRLRQESVAGLAGLMKMSDGLATLNHRRYAEFDTDLTDPEAELKQAILAFAGDTYLGLDAPSLTVDDLAYAQDHLRILSGLYGLLRPLDVIQPHRLEMKTRLTTDRGRSLYEFWGSSISEALEKDLAGKGVIINLASADYSRAIDRSALKVAVITPIFREVRDGGPKVIGLVAKRSRGAMARWVIQERVDDPARLPSFTRGGYTYDPASSTPESPVFVR